MEIMTPLGGSPYNPYDVFAQLRVWIAEQAGSAVALMTSAPSHCRAVRSEKTGTTYRGHLRPEPRVDKNRHHTTPELVRLEYDTPYSSLASRFLGGITPPLIAIDTAMIDRVPLRCGMVLSLIPSGEFVYSVVVVATRNFTIDRESSTRGLHGSGMICDPWAERILAGATFPLPPFWEGPGRRVPAAYWHFHSIGQIRGIRGMETPPPFTFVLADIPDEHVVEARTLLDMHKLDGRIRDYEIRVPELPVTRDRHPADRHW